MSSRAPDLGRCGPNIPSLPAADTFRDASVRAYSAMAAEHLAAPRMSLVPSRCEEIAARSPRFVDGHRRLGPHLERCASDAIA
eukprot:87511-Alexandrium_andersonii.AAC.1